MSRSRGRVIETLVELGFTALEGEVYAALVERSPATAYKVAQVLGKAAANVYKAVESLEKKGAILVDNGESRVLRAVPPGELLARVERDFRTARESAERALRGLGREDDDERIYRLQTREQVLERAIAMLRRAKVMAAVDLFPESLDELRAELVACAARGVRTLVQAYAETEAIPDAELVVAARADAMRRAWPGQWMNVVVDASEHLLALLRSEHGEVVQAVWSGSPYLSVVYFSGLEAEMRNAALAAAVERGASLAEIRSIVARWSASRPGGPKLPGVVALRGRLRDGAEADPRRSRS